MATMLLLNKRAGPFHLKPLKGSKEVRVWAGGTTLSVDEEEGKKLLRYKDVVQIKDGVQVKGGAGGKVAVPAGAGVSGKAQDAPAAPAK